MPSLLLPSISLTSSQQSNCRELLCHQQPLHLCYFLNVVALTTCLTKQFPVVALQRTFLLSTTLMPLLLPIILNVSALTICFAEQFLVVELQRISLPLTILTASVVVSLHPWCLCNIALLLNIDNLCYHPAHIISLSSLFSVVYLQSSLIFLSAAISLPLSTFPILSSWTIENFHCINVFCHHPCYDSI